jgi:cobalt-zinc-cadmium efflux system membrane fusion protein
MNDMHDEYEIADGSADHAEHHDAAHPPPPPGRRLDTATQGLVLLIFGAALGLLLFGVPTLLGRSAAGAEAPAPEAAAFAPTEQQWAGLKVQRVAEPDLAPQVQTEGRIALDDDVSTSVFSPYSGRVTRVIARAGDVVAAGAPLFAVQSTELAQAQNDMVSALATLKTARAQLDLAVTNENRQHQLFLGHGAALKDWQQSRVDLATAQGSVSSAAIAVAAVRNRLAILGLTPRDIARIGSTPNLESVSADTVVRAPIGGTITQRQISPGQNIVGAVASSGAAGAVYVIGDLSRLWMVANAPETDAAKFHAGDLARVTVPAYPGRQFAARVTYVAPVIDPVTHRLLVRAEVANPDGALKPDMLAQFEILTGAATPTLSVPETAVVYEGSDAHVWVADPARKTLALRPIKVGPAIGGAVQVLGGLKPTESVVTSGAVFIDRSLAQGS